MSTDYLERARQSRSSGAVLKTRLSLIRSRIPVTSVFVFEGQEDLGVYAVWIAKITSGAMYEPLVGAGKKQLLDLRRSLAMDRSGLAAAVYIFVDRDFDDLQGQRAGPDIYISDFYSLENSLVSEEVLWCLLTDDLRCTGEDDARERVRSVFREVRDQFAFAMTEANRRLYRAIRLGLKGAGIEDRIGRYVEISVRSIVPVYTAASLAVLIPLEREPTDDECREIDAAFDALTATSRHRGKYWLAFFKRWLDLIVEERRSPRNGIFSQPVQIRFSSQGLSLRTLAGYASPPESLATFIGHALAAVAQ